ncbi:oligosaccharide flippase family protein [Natronolimnohabitans innermongolicus]|uniref:Polysaccharide biosynthesis protein n=1 Tax=Natronolimnohabitans innermongolicus JCM 12255 TaxID=1227499 RepID=L9WQ98_9EURY|nr:lipopolysaccharide biosynthesis protein [Natronolimnohabitans innermongolicus]ELY51675.1 polysaccharide biosynthesis protein [Natronolimnohabitans innermongolicus JCM 12255]
MRLGQTSAVYLVSKVLGSVLGFLATVYFARVLGEDVLGQYALVLAVVTWLGIGGKVGINRAITKRISEGEEPEEFTGAGLVVMGAMMTIVAVAVIVFREQVNAYVGVPVAEFVVLLLFVTLYKSLINASLKGNHLVHVYAILSTGRQGTRAVAQIGLVALFGLGLSGMLWGYAIGYLVTATIGLWVLGLRPSMPGKEHIVSLFEYAKYAWLGSIRGESFETVDIAVLGFFVTQGLVGIYSVAWSIGKFLDIFGSAVSNTLFPEMSKVSAENDANAIAGLAEDGLTYAGLILIPGLVGALVIGDRLLQIYGDSFVAGTDVLAILVLALLIYTYNKQLLSILNAIDRPDLAFRANGVFIVVNVILNVILIWQIGWVGAAVATALSAAVGLVLAYYYASSYVPFSLPVAEITRQWIAAIGMGATVYVVRQLTETHWLAEYNAAFVVALVSVGAAVYFGTLFVISRTFRTTVTDNLPFDLPFVPN